MSRLFNVEVFNQTIGQGGPYYSGQEFYDLLGSADILSVQIIIDAVTVAGSIVLVTFQTNNTSQAQLWESTGATKTVTIPLVTDAPLQQTLIVPAVPTEVIGAFGRFEVTSDKPAVTVRIVVCGRSS